MAKSKLYGMEPDSAANGVAIGRRTCKPETAMRNAILTILAPVFVVAAAVTFTIWPTPGDFFASIKPMPEAVSAVETGGSLLAPTSIKTTLDRIGELPGTEDITASADPDCFANFAAADQGKIARCAGALYRTLVELDKAADRNVNPRAPAAPPILVASESILPQIKLAAAEVCRQKWSREPYGQFNFDSPACAAADVRLAIEK